jgi:RNA polymerase sigma factor (sigma-70 family)
VTSMRDESGRSDESRASGVFATTHWTQVLAARGESSEAKDALRELCAAYYAPVHSFIRRWRHGADDARDLTHEFFARLLAGHSLDHLDRGRGRFRSYLLGAVKHFLSDLRQREQAAKRGGGAAPVSLNARAPAAGDRDTPCRGWEPADASGFPPDAFFDRQWALNLLNRVLAALAHEQEQAGKTREFETLKPYLTGDAAGLSPSDAGAALGVSAGAVKVAIHRLRKRFRQMVRAEIAGTVEHGDEVSSEIDYLMQALSHAAAEFASESGPALR